ncbi:hypothetical protein F4820DRAFT_425058 [Hypoxylon rubiginosum]|uniref:Uncharacterized protein n=1 Tax=Hypoxylon rubiginosum TaxID=110542 RepID=A0ACB9YX39_9PEZI|nr:hypothetical protein F4820DRAFT_425058 [Hypoxylon rubiginosum]
MQPIAGCLVLFSWFSWSAFFYQAMALECCSCSLIGYLGLSGNASGGMISSRLRLGTSSRKECFFLFHESVLFPYRGSANLLCPSVQPCGLRVGCAVC